MQQVTHIEVVLGDWQKLPDECLAWSEDWKYLNALLGAVVWWKPALVRQSCRIGPSHSASSLDLLGFRVYTSFRLADRR